MLQKFEKQEKISVYKEKYELFREIKIKLQNLKEIQKNKKQVLEKLSPKINDLRINMDSYIVNDLKIYKDSFINTKYKEYSNKISRLRKEIF